MIRLSIYNIKLAMANVKKKMDKRNVGPRKSAE
jgi:hypothetical protein